MHSELRSFLLADVGLAAAIGVRLYPEILPQHPTLPAVTYTSISEIDTDDHEIGAAQLTGTLVQFSCWSRVSPDEADAVRKLLKNRLRALGRSGVLQGQIPSDGRSDFEQETNLYRSDADARIWHA